MARNSIINFFLGHPVDGFGSQFEDAQVILGPFGTIWDHLGQFGIIWDHLGLFLLLNVKFWQTSLGLESTLRSFQDHLGPFEAILGLFLVISGPKLKIEAD